MIESFQIGLLNSNMIYNNDICLCRIFQRQFYLIVIKRYFAGICQPETVQIVIGVIFCPYFRGCIDTYLLNTTDKCLSCIRLFRIDIVVLVFQFPVGNQINKGIAGLPVIVTGREL